MTKTDENAAGPPRRGRPPRIDRSKILRAARSLPPESLTVQAVANELGVDRKAVNYYVSDRDGLLRLVAVEAFHNELTRVRVDSDDDWRHAIRSLATGMRDSFIATGTLVNYYRFETQEDLRLLDPIEAVLRTMLRADFDTGTAGRALTFLAHLSMSCARDFVLTRRHGDHPQSAELRRVVRTTAPDEYEGMRQLIEVDINSGGAEQFDFDVHVLILGLERLLEHRTRTDA